MLKNLWTWSMLDPLLKPSQSRLSMISSRCVRKIGTSVPTTSNLSSTSVDSRLILFLNLKMVLRNSILMPKSRRSRLKNKSKRRRKSTIRTKELVKEEVSLRLTWKSPTESSRVST